MRPWIKAGLAKVGEREVPGPKENKWIAGLWLHLGISWLKGELNPWCGAFVAYCLKTAGLPYPKAFYRAASYATFGTPCKPMVGCIGVKTRKGGNHVFFIIGETKDRAYYKVLHGNAGDSVCVGDIFKADCTHIVWPEGVAVPLSPAPLPTMAKGAVAVSEA
jgi:uncharacterized protein (TIGR02594 family)